MIASIIPIYFSFKKFGGLGFQLTPVGKRYAFVLGLAPPTLPPREGYACLIVPARFIALLRDLNPTDSLPVETQAQFCLKVT